MLACLVLLAGVSGAGIWMLTQSYLQKARVATTTVMTSVTATSYDAAIATRDIQFGFDAQHTRNNPYEHIISPSNASRLSKQWSHQTGLFIRSSPVVDHGLVYVGSDVQTLYALDTSTGQKRWSFQTSDTIKSSPTVADGLVYVGSADHSLYALDASTGQKRWSYQTGDVIESSPAVADGLVYVGSADDSLYALHVSTGQKDWS